MAIKKAQTTAAGKAEEEKAAVANTESEAKVATESVKPAEKEVPEEKADVTEPTPEQEEAQEEAQDEGKMVKVRNNGKSFLYQASSGLYIQAGKEQLMLDDSWVKLQEQVRLLERV